MTTGLNTEKAVSAAVGASEIDRFSIEIGGGSANSGCQLLPPSLLTFADCPKLYYLPVVLAFDLWLLHPYRGFITLSLNLHFVCTLLCTGC